MQNVENISNPVGKEEGEVEVEGEQSRPRSTAQTQDWTTAALAHASGLVTLVLSVAGGVGVLIGPAIALALYLGYRERSRFVAFHALQACVYQVVGIVGYVVLVAVLATGITAAWTVSGVLSAVLIGILMMPLALLVTILAALILVAAPFVWLGYSLYTAYQVYQGRNYLYPIIGTWLEQEVNF
jgi:hypothetical protein